MKVRTAITESNFGTRLTVLSCSAMAILVAVAVSACTGSTPSATPTSLSAAAPTSPAPLSRRQLRKHRRQQLGIVNGDAKRTDVLCAEPAVQRAIANGDAIDSDVRGPEPACRSCSRHRAAHGNNGTVAREH